MCISAQVTLLPSLSLSTSLLQATVQQLACGLPALVEEWCFINKINSVVHCQPLAIRRYPDFLTSSTCLSSGAWEALQGGWDGHVMLIACSSPAAANAQALHREKSNWIKLVAKLRCIWCYRHSHCSWRDRRQRLSLQNL